jgi:hypothetical protein
MTDIAAVSEAIPKNHDDVFKTNCWSTNELYDFFQSHANFSNEEAMNFAILLYRSAVIRRDPKTDEYLIDQHVMSLDWQEELEAYNASKSA